MQALYTCAAVSMRIIYAWLTEWNDAAIKNQFARKGIQLHVKLHLERGCSWFHISVHHEMSAKYYHTENMVYGKLWSPISHRYTSHVYLRLVTRHLAIWLRYDNNVTAIIAWYSNIPILIKMVILCLITLGLVYHVPLGLYSTVRHRCLVFLFFFT